MKQMPKLLLVLSIFFLAYFVGEVICVIVSFKVPPVPTNIIHIAYSLAYLSLAVWMMSHYGNLKRPSIYIIIATLLGITNKLFTFWAQGNAQMESVSFALASTAIYLPFLIFKCMGFFKLAKQLPRHSMSRGMAVVIPWAELSLIILPSVAAILNEEGVIACSHNVYSGIAEVLYLIELLAIGLFCLCFPQADAPEYPRTND